MKLFKITTLAIAALFMASCDDTTDSIGQSVTNRVDGLNISDARYNVITESAATGSVLSNNSNIACMGALTLGEKLAEELLKIWLGLRFDPASASAPKVAGYRAYDEARG